MSARSWRGLVAVALLTAASGCAGLSDDEVRATATAFTDPTSSVRERCALLAPATRTALEADQEAPCAEFLGSVPVGSGGIESVEVWGEEARVKLADDTLFLTRTGVGWRVMAAACRPGRPDEPYSCRVEPS